MNDTKVYTGPLMMNNRSITAAMHTLLSKEQHNTSPIRVHELINLLSFLESAVMSKKIFFDGTLPVADKEHTVSTFEMLHRKTSSLDIKNALGINIIPTEIKKEDFPSLLSGAIDQSFHLITHLKISEEKESKLLDGDIGDFSRLFENYLPKESRKNEIATLIDDIANNNNSFRGSKCATAVLLSHKNGEDLYDIVFGHFKQAKTERGKRLLIASLIDRFRVNYINSQAQKHNAAYLSSPNLESLRDQQILLFWKHIFEQMGKKEILARNKDISNKLFDHSFNSFPVGLAILVNTKGNNPLNLLDTAVEYYDHNFSKVTSTLSIENRYATLPHEQIQQMEEEAFKKHYSVLHRKEYKNVSTSYKIGKKILPIATRFALGPVTDIFEGLLDTDMVSEFIGEETIDNISDKIEKNVVNIFSSSSKNNTHNLYIDHYHRLNEFYTNSLDTLEDGLRLSNKIERLFGRKLIL